MNRVQFQFELQQLENSEDDVDKFYYINAWQITQSLILTICANFMFLRIYFIFKLLIGLTICCIYSMFIIDDPMQIFKVKERRISWKESKLIILLLPVKYHDKSHFEANGGAPDGTVDFIDHLPPHRPTNGVYL